MTPPPPSQRTHDGGNDAAVGRSARRAAPDGHRFPGFRPIDANFIYTPNQFFDVLLPHASRGCLRLVGYLLRRTLGWLDHDGRPLEQRISVTYNELIRDAGVSRGGLKKAIDEAIDGRYLRCTRRGKPKAAGQSAVSARYELCWDDTGEYRGTPADFRGFYTGEGRRSPIPDDYFDAVVRHEPLAVAKVVGIVLRQTIGYQNQFGGRRQQAALSFSDLQRRTGLADRKTLCKAVHDALDVGYLQLVAEGHFDPDAARTSAAATYGVRWTVGSETPPAAGRRSVQKSHRRPATDRSRIPTEPSVHEPHRDRFTHPTDNGSEAPPASKGRKTPKDTSKQPTPEVAAAIGLLGGLGFDAAAVAAIVGSAPPEAIFRQVAWLPQRKATRNKLGLLRKAIAEDWAAPTAPLPAACPARKPDPSPHAEPYRRFLLRREAELPTERPDDWAQYQRWQSQQMRRRGKPLDETQRLKDLRAFFADELPDLRQWAEQHDDAAE